MSHGHAQFVPSGPLPSSPAARPSPQQQRDPESSPHRQLARRLGTYGAVILRDHIKVSYVNHRDVWEKQIGQLVTAFSIALGHHEETMKKTADEQRAAAALKMFVFSLITAGVMRWAGTFIQFKVFPHFMERPKTNFIHVTDVTWPPGINKLLQVTDLDFNRQMAAFVGGIVQDAGNLTSGYLSKRLRADLFGGMAASDNLSLVRITEDALKKALTDGTQVVATEMDNAIFWMQEAPEFGERWAAFSNGNETLARQRIHAHLQAVRDTWARAWPYYGQNPHQFSQELLAQAIERALWAGWIDGYFSQFSKKEGFTWEELFSKQLDRQLDNEHVGYSPEFYMMIYDFIIGDAIINRLKLLNVAKAETVKGKLEQKNRQKEVGAPDATVGIKGKIDTLDEMRAIWQWSREYPNHAQEMVRRIGTEGVPRTLPPIPAY